jgi:hypothetical protein
MFYLEALESRPISYEARIHRRLFTILALGFVAYAHAATDRSRPEVTRDSSIGYSSVESALADLESQPGNIVTLQGGWTIISNPNNLTVWSFTPKAHPAHPAAVRRTSVERNGDVYMVMQALCEAEKAPCDALIDEFKQLNQQMREYIRNQKRKPEDQSAD